MLPLQRLFRLEIALYRQLRSQPAAPDDIGDAATNWHLVTRP
jgi:hypothetical protein